MNVCRGISEFIPLFITPKPHTSPSVDSWDIDPCIFGFVRAGERTIGIHPFIVNNNSFL